MNAMNKDNLRKVQLFNNDNIIPDIQYAIASMGIGEVAWIISKS